MFADAHCDTISLILDKDQELFRNRAHVDLERMQEVGAGLQFFAAWVTPGYSKLSGYARAKDIFGKFHEEYEKNREYMAKIERVSDLEETERTGKVGALLTIEDGEAIEGDLDKLEEFYAMGVRGMTLTWNGRNALADGSGCENAGGLTSFGREAVRKMQELGMFVDVSHISDKGFWDVVKMVKKPIIATHSNSRAVCSHRRNLDDEQIKAIIEMKGFVGINFYSEFLAEKGASRVADIVRHMEHILNLGGEDVLGLGADFDGCDSLPEGITGVQDVVKVEKAMREAGFGEELVGKILYGNLRGYLKSIKI